MLTNVINIPFKVHTASLLAFLHPLIIQVGVKSLKKKRINSNLLCFHPPTGLQECFSADITAQRPGKPISPQLYHSLLPASCPDDVTHHMVFGSIKPEKRFSQWRGEGEKRRRAGAVHRLDTENKRFALPPVCTVSRR